jgi:hypothetical protein
MATRLLFRAARTSAVASTPSMPSIRCAAWAARGRVQRDFAATMNSKYPPVVEPKKPSKRTKRLPKPPGAPNAPMAVDGKRRPRLHAIHDFFKASFPSFNYNRRKPFPDEFVRLHRHQGWPRLKLVYRHPVRDAAWRAYHVAVYEAFSDTFARSLRQTFFWAKLCKYVGVEPRIDDIEGMRQVCSSFRKKKKMKGDSWQSRQY